MFPFARVSQCECAAFLFGTDEARAADNSPLLRLYKNCVLRTLNKWQPANLYKSRNATSKIKVFAPFYCIKTRKKVQPFPVQIAPQRQLNVFARICGNGAKTPSRPYVSVRMCITMRIRNFPFRNGRSGPQTIRRCCCNIPIIAYCSKV